MSRNKRAKSRMSRFGGEPEPKKAIAIEANNAHHAAGPNHAKKCFLISPFFADYALRYQEYRPVSGNTVVLLIQLTARQPIE